MPTAMGFSVTSSSFCNAHRPPLHILQFNTSDGSWDRNWFKRELYCCGSFPKDCRAWWSSSAKSMKTAVRSFLTLLLPLAEKSINYGGHQHGKKQIVPVCITMKNTICEAERKEECHNCAGGSACIYLFSNFANFCKSCHILYIGIFRRFLKLPLSVQTSATKDSGNFPGPGLLAPFRVSGALASA